MSYYESNNSAWPNTRAGWDRSGATTFQRPHASNQPDLTVRYTAQMKTEDTAFGSQLDEVDRAVDNLVKSGKMFAPQRRESLPVVTPRPFPIEHAEPRMSPLQQLPPGRHFAAVPEYDPIRNLPTASLQKFYAQQRFQPRPSEAEQLMQAQRRLAAQRERELRNYHQEQQFNRTIMAEMSSTYGKERVMSPGSMTEEERRELIARQRAALYSSEGQIHHEDGLSVDENGTPRQMTNTGSVTGSTRGPSPLSFDPFGLPSQNGNDMQNKMGDHHQSSATVGNTPSRSRTNSASSPSSKSANFNMFDNGNQQQVQNQNRTSASSPGGSPPRGQSSRGPGGAMGPGGVAPIGTRPSSQAQATNPALSNKRSTTPLPSPLSYGFTNNEDPFNNGMPKERSSSAASNQSGAPNGQDGANLPNWGNSKVWGNNKGLGSVASVWALS